MKDYQDDPKGEYGLFLLKNPNILDENFFKNIFNYSSDIIFSLEKIYRGEQSALVWFAPKKIVEHLGNVSLLELEDYTSNLPLDKIQSWEVNKKKGDKKKEYEGFHFFKEISIENDEKVVFQIVFKKENNQLQTTLRILVSASTSLRRSIIAKHLDKNISDQSIFVRSDKKFSSKQILGQFKKRSLYPKEVKRQYLLPGEIIAFLK